MITDKQVEAALLAWNSTKGRSNGALKMRAALDAAEKAAWLPISEAGSLDRVFVSGIQKASGSCQAYRWYHEDVTDEKGVPMDHPDADMFRPLPKGPSDE